MTSSVHTVSNFSKCSVGKTAFSALTLLVWQQEGRADCKKLTGGVLCGYLSGAERDTDLYIAQLTPLLLTVSFFSEIQTGFTFLVPAHLGSPGKRAVRRVCVCVHSVQHMHTNIQRTHKTTKRY